MHSIRSLCLAIFMVTGLSFSSLAQDFVVVEIPGTSTRIKYEPGDEITFRMIDSIGIYKGDIQQINDSSFVMNGTSFRYDLISKVKNVKQKKWQPALAGMLVNFSVGYGSLQIIYSLLARQYPLVDPLMARFMVSAIGISGIFYASHKYWYRIDDGRYRIRRLDTRIDVNQ